MATIRNATSSPYNLSHPMNFLFFVIVVLLFALTTKPTNADEKVNIYNLSFTHSVQNILKNTIEDSLELADKNYAEQLRLNYMQLPIDTPSLCNEMKKGNIDIFFSAHYPSDLTDCKSERISFNLLNKAMGLRLITIHKDNFEEFSKIESLRDLQKFTVGVGHEWKDKDIYTSSHIKYSESILNQSLLPMLEKKRFDFLATSALDKLSFSPSTYIYNAENLSGATTHKNNKQLDNLITLDDFFIFYPVPVEMHISRQNTQLTTLLKNGLILFVESGKASTMVNKEVSDNYLNPNKKVRILLLDNPLFDDKKNLEFSNELIATLPKNIVILPH